MKVRGADAGRRVVNGHVAEIPPSTIRQGPVMGPILGSGGLAIMIPPSGLAVLLGVIAELSIGRILIAINLPGIIIDVAPAFKASRCPGPKSCTPGRRTSSLSVSSSSWSSA